MQSSPSSQEWARLLEQQSQRIGYLYQALVRLLGRERALAALDRSLTLRA